VTIHPGTGFAIGDIWLCHGHAWPAKEFLDSKAVVTGHNHASVELTDKLGYGWRNPVWVRAELDRKKLKERYRGTAARKKLPELILIPPFNDFAGLVPLNRGARHAKPYLREGPNPMFRISRKRKAKVYMLDGTFLGELGKL
jgi:metallophosphoesterase superfamily enzyme